MVGPKFVNSFFHRAKSEISSLSYMWDILAYPPPVWCWIEPNVLKSGHLALSSTKQVDDISHVLHVGQAGNFTFSPVFDTTCGQCPPT